MNIQSMNVQSLPRMTPEAFFDWSARQERRYELVDGVARMQPYVKFNHTRVVRNLMLLMHGALDPARYEVAAVDFAVRVNADSLRFPDLVVVTAGTDGHARETNTPLLVVEVLSESTMHVDFGDKRHEYLQLASLGTYLIAAQDKPHLWCWSRQDDGTWPDDPVQMEDAAGRLDLPRLQIALPVAAIYQGVN